VVVKLNPSSGASLRSVSLLDFDDEGATIDPIVPVGVAGAGSDPVPSKVAANVDDVPAAFLSVQPSRVPESSGKKTDGAAAKTHEGFARVEETLIGEDAQEDPQFRFNDLGGIFLHRPIYFQGPDIDPYLSWVREVDVATMMATLSHEIEFGSAGVPLPSQTASAMEGQ